MKSPCFSETLNASRDMLEAGALILAGVTAEDRDGEVRFTCESIKNLDEVASAAAKQLRVEVISENALEGVRRRLAGVKPSSPKEAGGVVIAMRLAGGREVEITLPEPAACTPAMRGALKGVEGVADVELI